MSGSKSASEIKEYEYSNDNGEIWIKYVDNIDINKEGTYTIKARAINNVGTIGNQTINRTIKIDKTSPIINGVEDNVSYYESIKPTALDELSGIKKVELEKNGEVVESYELGDVIKDAGQYILRVTDNANNTETKVFSISQKRAVTAYIEYSIYEITNCNVTAYIEYSIYEITNCNVTAYISFNDDSAKITNNAGKNEIVFYRKW